MKKFLELGDRFAAKSDWKDFALTKVCLCSMGVLIGTALPKTARKAAYIAAGTLFTASYIPLMIKVAQTAIEMMDEEKA